MNKDHNVVVKHDMAKAYDRVSSKYLVKVLRRFGFSKRIIDMVVRLISNNWYTILMNRHSFGFFPIFRMFKAGQSIIPHSFYNCS